MNPTLNCLILFIIFVNLGDPRLIALRVGRQKIFIPPPSPHSQMVELWEVSSDMGAGCQTNSPARKSHVKGAEHTTGHTAHEMGKGGALSFKKDVYKVHMGRLAQFSSAFNAMRSASKLHVRLAHCTLRYMYTYSQTCIEVHSLRCIVFYPTHCTHCTLYIVHCILRCAYCSFCIGFSAKFQAAKAEPTKFSLFNRLHCQRSLNDVLSLLKSQTNTYKYHIIQENFITST